MHLEMCGNKQRPLGGDRQRPCGYRFSKTVIHRHHDMLTETHYRQGSRHTVKGGSFRKADWKLLT